MGLSALEICAIVFASIFVLVVVVKCCLTVSQQNKMHNRGVDVGHDNAVYVLPQNDSPFLHDGRSYGATYTQSSGYPQTYPLTYNIHGSNTPVYYYPQPASPVEERRDIILPPSYQQHYASAPQPPPPPPYTESERNIQNHHSVFLK